MRLFFCTNESEKGGSFTNVQQNVNVNIFMSQCYSLLSKWKTKGAGAVLKLFLSSHGHLASGMKTSLDILLGNSDQVSVFDAYVDECSVQEKLDAFYASVSENDEVILLSDMYGGSVNQVMFTYLHKPNTRLVAGVNLACVLELSIQESVSDEQLEEIVERSREMLRVVKDDSVETTEEDFF